MIQGRKIQRQSGLQLRFVTDKPSSCRTRGLCPLSVVFPTNQEILPSVASLDTLHCWDPKGCLPITLSEILNVIHEYTAQL